MGSGEEERNTCLLKFTTILSFAIEVPYRLTLAGALYLCIFKKIYERGEGERKKDKEIEERRGQTIS